MDIPGHQHSLMTARDAGMVACTSCGIVARPDVASCPRCHARMQSRNTGSIQRVLAWLIAGLIVYVPANMYPMLRTTQMFKSQDSTIVGGVVDLTLHSAVEFIGRWSMIDVFVVAILVALVQFDVLASIKPGLAAACFALSVVFTMLSAQAFDPRLIWDLTDEGTAR